MEDDTLIKVGLLSIVLPIVKGESVLGMHMYC